MKTRGPHTCNWAIIKQLKTKKFLDDERGLTDDDDGGDDDDECEEK